MQRLDVPKIVKALAPGAVIGDGDLAQTKAILTAGFHFRFGIPAALVRQTVASLLLNLPGVY